MLAGAVRAGARPVFNVVQKGRSEMWRRIKKWRLQGVKPVCKL